MPTAITHEPIFNTPVSSTNTAVVRWSGTTGATLQDSGVLIDGSNNLIIPAQGDLRLSDTTGGQYVALQAAGTTTSHTLTLPATQGGSSTVLTNDGAGALTWAAAGPTQATQSAIEAETNQDTYIPPDLMKYHPGVAKVWIRFYQSNSSHTMGASYGVASIADGGAAGFSDFTWSTTFSSAEYAILVSAEAASVSGMEAGSKAAGTVTVRFWDMNGTYNDALHASVACFGDL